MQSSIIAACLLASSVAAAETPSEPPSSPDPAHYLQASGMAGYAAPVGLSAMLAVSGGYRLAHPWWLHGQLSYGPGADDEGKGSVMQARLGFEARKSRGIVTGFFVFDLGGQRATWRSSDAMESDKMSALVIVPGGGVEVGNERVRFRAALEVDVAFVGNRQRQSPSGMTSELVTGVAGAHFVGGLAVQW